MSYLCLFDESGRLLEQMNGALQSTARPATGIQWAEGFVGPKSRSERCKEENDLLPHPGIQPRPSSP
jgi:hypothetical protein